MIPFSIIIPAYNEEKYIEKTINSIKEQNYGDCEVIAVANGCTDLTLEILNKCDNIKTLNLAEANVSKARNKGAQEANGEVLIFLDADTSLNPGCLEIIQNNFTKDCSVATTKVLPDIGKRKYQLAMWSKNVYNRTGLYKGCSGALIC